MKLDMVFPIVTIPIVVLRQLQVGDEVRVTKGRFEGRVSTISKSDRVDFKLKGIGQWFAEGDLERNIVSPRPVLAKACCPFPPEHIIVAKARA